MSCHGERQYRPCVWCDRPFHIWRFELKQLNRGKFCGRRCYYAARKAFSNALADGRLAAVLAPERARAKAERLAALSDDSYTEMEARYGHHLPPKVIC
jgi:hypothetical protein